MTAHADFVMALASPAGGSHALLRLAGGGLRAVLEARQGAVPDPWQVWSGEWDCNGVALPVRVLWCPGPCTFTGEDLVELTVPGSRAVVDVVMNSLRQHGAEEAEPGYFTRRAFANGRMRLEQAEALLALVHAVDGAAAQRALSWLRGSLGAEVKELRAHLLHLRALCEAGLDFMEEDDVRAFEPAWMRQQVESIHAALIRWQRAAQSHSQIPLVVLAGPANAGKSALFNALTGGRALVSAQAGTTRDWLDGTWQLPGRAVRLLDTAGWLDLQDRQVSEGVAAIDDEAVAKGKAMIEAAAMVLWCSAPDAVLPEVLLSTNAVECVVATKSDLGPADARAELVCSAESGAGLSELSQRVLEVLGDDPGLPRRQQILLTRALERCQQILDAPVVPPDELLAADLRQAAADLGELLGSQTPDEILGAIFSQFCIGK